MKNIKKIASVIMACSMLLSVVGCGTKETSTEKGKNGTVKVTMWDGSPGQKEYTEAMVADFNNTKGKELGIEIEYTCKSDIGTQLDVAFKTNQQPDLFSGKGVKDCVDKGLIIAYEDLKDGAEWVKHFESIDMSGSKFSYNGKHYTLPGSSLLCGLIYNKDLFKEAGIVDENGEATPPKTLSEMREYAKRITALGDNKFGIAFPMKWNAWILYDVLLASSNNGSNGFDYDKGEYDYRIFKPALETIKNILDDKSAYPGWEMLDNDPARARFAEGKIGMKYAFSWDVGVLEDQFPAQCDWGVAPIPCADGLNEKYYQYMNVECTTLMGATLKDKLTDEQILEMMKWLTGDENVRKAYEKGIYFSWNAEIVKEADTSNLSEHFIEFGNLLETAAVYPPTPSMDVTGQPTFADLFINEVLTNKITIDEMLEKYTKIANEGMRKYDEYNPENTSSMYKKSVDRVIK